MSAADDAWQAALAAEYEAVFAYSVLGPRLSGDDRRRAVTDQAAHVALRDATAAAITAAGLQPVAALADYPDVYPSGANGAVRTKAAQVEDGCAAAWRHLYALAPQAQRAVVQRALTASAVRATAWRQALGLTRPTTPFPGI